MAEEILVKEALTEEMKVAGAELTRKLDEVSWPVVASFWYFAPSENQWKLMLASPRVESDGPRLAYEEIGKALRTLEAYFDGLEYISAVAPGHHVVQALALAASTVPTGKTLSGRFSAKMINGRYIEDAYIYRVDPELAAA
jgi:hypothetical protein